MNAGKAWDRFWYSDASLVRLGLFRMVLLATAVHATAPAIRMVFNRADSAADPSLPRPWNPIYFVEALSIGPPDATMARVILALTILVLACAIIGFRTRLACSLAAPILLWWWGLAYSLGQAHHEKIALTFGILALPFTSCGGRLSIDAFLRRWRLADSEGTALPTTSPFAGVPIRVVQVAAALGYLLAGGSKLWIVGPSWMNGYTLQAIMLGTDSPWAALFSRHLFLSQIMSAGLLAIQLTFPLVFVAPALRWVLVPAATAFHLLAWPTMGSGPYLPLWLPLIAAFFALEEAPFRLAGLLRRGPLAWRILVGVTVACAAGGALWVYFLPVPRVLALTLVPPALVFVLSALPRARATVVFDGACPPCRRTIGVLRGLDWARRLEFLDLRRWGEIEARLPGLDCDRCLATMHVVDAEGRVVTGFDSFRSLFWRLPATVFLAPILQFRPVAALGRRADARIARSGRPGVRPDGSCRRHDGD